MKPLYRPPAIYAVTQERRQRDALRDAERAARDQEKKIKDAINQHGDRMSEEGRGLLTGIAESLKKIAGAVRR
jgi:hypothetical protein